MKAKGVAKRISIWLFCLVCMFGVSIGISNFKMEEAYAASSYTHTATIYTSSSYLNLTFSYTNTTSSARTKASNVISDLYSLYGTKSFTASGYMYVGNSSTATVSLTCMCDNSSNMEMMTYVNGYMYMVTMSTSQVVVSNLPTSTSNTVLVDGTYSITAVSDTVKEVVALNSVSVSLSSSTVGRNASVTASATATMSSGSYTGSYTWTVSSSSLASVSGSGSSVTINSKDTNGTVTVTCICTYDGASKSGTATLEIYEAYTSPPSVYFSSIPSSLVNINGLDYVSSGFTIETKDAETFMYKTPTSDDYKSGTAPYTVSASAGDGLYSFMAENSHASSGELNVYLDTTAPELSYAYNDDFSYTFKASDTGSGIRYIKDSAGNVVASYGMGETEGEYTLSSDSVAGDYTFYAEDFVGNKSATSTVSIYKREVSGRFEYYNDSNCCSFWWDADGWTATLDGRGSSYEYIEGTKITKEGDHTIYLVSPYGEETAYNFTIDHYYVVSHIQEATCTEGEFEMLVCSQCGNVSKVYLTDEGGLGHDWKLVSSPPSCFDEGDYVYECARDGCDATYSNHVYGVGHTYISEEIEPTCTYEGRVVYTCLYCGDTYTEYTGEFAEHKYAVSDYAAATCTEDGLRTYTCTMCGLASYTEYVEALGHEYRLTDEYRDEDGNVIRTFTCRYCNDFYIVNEGAVISTTAQKAVDAIDAYMQYIWLILGAAVVIWGIFLGGRYAMAKREDQEVKARKSVVDFIVGVVFIAVIFFGLPYLVYAFALLA